MWELLLIKGNIIVAMIIGFLVSVAISFIWMNGISLLNFMMQHGHILQKLRYWIVASEASEINKEFLKSELIRANESHPKDGNDIMEEAYILAGGKRWVCALCMSIYLSIFWFIPLSVCFVRMDAIFGVTFIVTFYPLIYNTFKYG